MVIVLLSESGPCVAITCFHDLADLYGMGTMSGRGGRYDSHEQEISEPAPNPAHRMICFPPSLSLSVTRRQLILANRFACRSVSSSMSSSSSPVPDPERVSELSENLTRIRSRVQDLSRDKPRTLVAVSKYKPASDVLACHQNENGQLDFGENYVQELVEKAAQVRFASMPYMN